MSERELSGKEEAICDRDSSGCTIFATAKIVVLVVGKSGASNGILVGNLVAMRCFP